MAVFLTKLLLALALQTQPVRAAELAFDFKAAQVMLVGVLKWKDPAWTRFSPRGRQDQALEQALRANGVTEENMHALYDVNATRDAILAALDSAIRDASGDLIFYFTGHGTHGDLNPDEIYITPYDIIDDYDAHAISTELLYDRIAENFKGKRVILLGDFCYSGALARVAKRLATEKGIPALALTSSTEGTESTENWTFTQVLTDALNGSPLADQNGDRAITWDELFSEIDQAMVAREEQDAFHQTWVIDSTEILRLRGRFDYGAGDLVESVRKNGDWRAARILGQRGKNRYVVEFYDYSKKVQRIRSAKKIRPIE